MGNPEGLGKSERLSDTLRIRLIRSRGESIYIRPLKVSRYHNNRQGPRLTLSFTRKSGKSVSRNVAKRQLRELFRRNKSTLGPFDYVFTASRGLNVMTGADWQRIRESVLNWCSRGALDDFSVKEIKMHRSN